MSEKGKGANKANWGDFNKSLQGADVKKAQKPKAVTTKQAKEGSENG